MWMFGGFTWARDFRWDDGVLGAGAAVCMTVRRMRSRSCGTTKVMRIPEGDSPNESLPKRNGCLVSRQLGL